MDNEKHEFGAINVEEAEEGYRIKVKKNGRPVKKSIDDVSKVKNEKKLRSLTVEKSRAVGGAGKKREGDRDEKGRKGKEGKGRDIIHGQRRA